MARGKDEADGPVQAIRKARAPLPRNGPLGQHQGTLSLLLIPPPPCGDSLRCQASLTAILLFIPYHDTADHIMLEALQEQETVHAPPHPVHIKITATAVKGGAYLPYMFPKGSINACAAVRCIQLHICSLPHVPALAEALHLDFFKEGAAGYQPLNPAHHPALLP